MKTLVLYTFNLYNDRVEFFVKHGLFKSNNVDFVFICNNSEFKIDNLPDYVIYINRPNTGYDFGAWSDALLNYHYADKDYDTYIFVNSSVYGPFIKEDDKKIHWTDIFCNGLTDDIKLFGVTIYSNCFPIDKFISMINYINKDDEEEEKNNNFTIKYTFPNAFLQSFVFSVKKQTLLDLIDVKIFSKNFDINFSDCTKKEEYMSRYIISKGGNIAGTCSYYKGVDWRFIDKTSADYSINFLDEMMSPECYEKGIIDPYETIFIRGNRGIQIKELEKDIRCEKKIAIITSNYGNYDTLINHNIHYKNVDWFCFTDQNIESTQWSIITKPYHLMDITDGKNSFKKIMKNPSIYNMMSAKYYKMNYHKIDILKNYDYIVWIDTRIALKYEFIPFIFSMVYHKYKLINFKHSIHSNILDELNTSLLQQRYIDQDINEQYKIYIKDGFKDDIGLFENGIIIRALNDKITNKIFEDWWEHNVKYSFQDQISYPYILWKHNKKPDYIILDNIFDNKYNFVLPRSK